MLERLKFGVVDEVDLISSAKGPTSVRIQTLPFIFCADIQNWVENLSLVMLFFTKGQGREGKSH